MIPLTIAILTKNEPEAFRLIGRICEQIQPCDRMIVVDDHSDDAFQAILAFYQAAYPFLEVEQHALNDDFAAHRNFAGALAGSGAWTIQIDADEWVAPTFLEAIRGKIESHPDVDCFPLARINTVHKGDSPQIPAINWDHPERMGYQNYPDLQRRVYRVGDTLRWRARMHACLDGFTKLIPLTGPQCSLIHHKAHTKFHRMNVIYDRIRRTKPDGAGRPSTQ